MYQPGHSRIDYVRVLYRGPVEGTDRWQNAVRDHIPERARLTAAEMRKHCKFGTMFDGATKKVVSHFEIWGSMADEFAYTMPINWRNDITRIDFRSTIPDPPKDPTELTQEFMTVNGNARRTIGYKVSPPRTKVDGRDAGGKSITIGSHESARRLAIYKRGSEHWALECQFSRDGVRDVLLTAYAYWAEHAGVQWYDALVKVAYQRSADHVLNVTGHTMEEWYGDDFWQNQDGIYNSQESLLALMDTTWEKLDPTAKQSFFEATIKCDGYVHQHVGTARDIIDQLEPEREPVLDYDDRQNDEEEGSDPIDLRKMFDSLNYEEYDPNAESDC